MKNFIYIIIVMVALVVAFCVCFRTWMDNEVFIHRICFHRYMGTATLIDKGPYEVMCHWKPIDRRGLDERYGTCENIQVGETITNYPEASYTCD